jgi:hypothetical protein
VLEHIWRVHCAVVADTKLSKRYETRCAMVNTATGVTMITRWSYAGGRSGGEGDLGGKIVGIEGDGAAGAVAGRLGLAV